MNGCSVSAALFFDFEPFRTFLFIVWFGTRNLPSPGG
jgi:hypothetical protein